MPELSRAARSSLPSRSLATLPGRSLNSLRDRGLLPTLRYIRSYAEDALFELRYGVRTDKWVGLEDLEVVGDKDTASNYQRVKVFVFRSAMHSFQIPPDGTFVDYGSGKGRVLLLAVLYGFRSTVGVEFSKDLCFSSEQNLERFRDRTSKKFDSRIENVDAACYPVKDDECVFFFYNPFDDKVLEKVLGNIRLSLQSTPRPIHVIYARPLQRHLLDDDPFWCKVGETSAGGLDTFVYYRPR